MSANGGSWNIRQLEIDSDATSFRRLPTGYDSIDPQTLMFSLDEDNAHARYVNEVLQPAPGMKMRDVECGPDNILPYFPPLDYTGIDLNEKHIDYARRRYGNGDRFIVGNAAVDMKREEKQFDLINVSALLHHITDEEAISLFASLASLLKPNGRNVWLPKQRIAVRLANYLDSGTNIRTRKVISGY